MALHDDQARNTSVGTQYYVDELNRRYQESQTNSMLGFTKRITRMTIVITVATLVNVGVAIGMLCVMLMGSL